MYIINAFRADVGDRYACRGVTNNGVSILCDKMFSVLAYFLMHLCVDVLRMYEI